MEVKLFWENIKEIVRKNLSHAVTLGNLSLGTFSIIYAIEGNYELSISLIMLAMLFDGIDGKLAVKLDACSDLGKELDSLSDIVSFGLAPMVLLYTLYLSGFGFFGLLPLLIFPAAGVCRLARFNNESSSSIGFTGLPITIAGGVIASLALHEFFLQTWVSLLIPLVLSFLMVSNIPYPALKKNHDDMNSNLFVFVLFYSGVLLFVLSVILLPELVFYLLSIYVFFGFIHGLYRFVKRMRTEYCSCESSTENLICEGTTEEFVKENS